MTNRNHERQTRCLLSAEEGGPRGVEKMHSLVGRCRAVHGNCGTAVFGEGGAGLRVVVLRWPQNVVVKSMDFEVLKEES